MNRLLSKSSILYACYNDEKKDISTLYENVGTIIFSEKPQDLIGLIRGNNPDLVLLEVDRLDLHYKPILSAYANYPNTGFILITHMVCNKALMEVMKRMLFYGIFDKAAENRKILAAIYDRLSMTKDIHTGILGKPFLLNRIKQTKNFAILVIEIDNTDYYFGAYGFEFGDEIIATAVGFIDEIKPEGCTLYQVQDDQFAAVFEDCDEKVAEDFAQILNAATNSNTIEVSNIELNISLTIGIAKGAGEELLTMGRLALKEAKLQGKKPYHVYEGKTTDEILQEHNLKWIQKVKFALENNDIQPYFQPIYNNKTKKIEKYECLARMLDEGEVFAPGQFFGSAKVVGLLPNISYVIISKSFTHFSGKNYEFAINVSEDDLRSGKFIEYISNRCEHFGINPEQVCIEILENIGSSSNNRMVSQIKELKSLGFRIAIDDFGTESSNFSRVFDLEVDYIKIDGSFIRYLDTDPKCVKITKTIANFAKTIGAKTVAEFVHSKSIQDIVVEIGIDYSQGYFLGKPLPKILD